jgi:hypothetical protein
LNALAGDVGRLRRRLDRESYDGFLVGRIADHVETLDCLAGPTAAELAHVSATYGVDDEEAVAGALEMVDARCRELRGLLGGKAR